VGPEPIHVQVVADDVADPLFARVLNTVVGGNRLAREVAASGHPVRPPACIITGGDTTVTVKGDGLGGRNQESVLAAALDIAGLDGVVVFSAGTDGTDGPTDADGAIADGQTLARQPDAHLPLDRNDSYHYFQSLGDVVITGPTNTNVMDVRQLLAGSGK
jgi:glycerate 2-kinase